MSVDQQLGPVYNLSVVDVCNNALDLVGQEPIDSFADGTPAAKAAQRYFPSILRAMLRDHKWNFAYRRVYLPQLSQETILQILGGYGGGGYGGGSYGGGQNTIEITEMPANIWVYWYGTPNNMVRALRINNTDKCQFAVEGRILMADESPVLLDYIAYVDDPNVWDGMFQQAFENTLASRFALRLLKDRLLASELASIGLRLMLEAESVDGQEGSPERLQSDYFISIRE